MKFEIYLNGQPELKIWLNYAQVYGDERTNKILQSYLNIILLHQTLDSNQVKTLNDKEYSIINFTDVINILKIDHKQVYDWGFDWLKRLIEYDWLTGIRYEITAGTKPEFISENYPMLSTLDLFGILNIIYTEPN